MYLVAIPCNIANFYFLSYSFAEKNISSLVGVIKIDVTSGM